MSTGGGGFDMGSRCETCRFFYVDGDQYVCRRFPPTTILFEAKRERGAPGSGIEGIQFVFQSVFPRMLASGWCGEHSPG